MPFFPNQNWPSDKTRPILFIDLEMTGLNSDLHEIVEVAALLVSPVDYSIQNSYYTKVLPSRIETADPEALKIINFHPKDWSDAIPLRQMLVELSNLSPHVILAGWSINTDYDFLVKSLARENLPFFFDNYLIEVWTLAYVKYHSDSTVPKTSLHNICKLLTIPLEIHKPDSDIRATYEIFKRLVVLSPHVPAL